MDPDAKCPFCRVPAPTSDEGAIEWIKKRVEMDDANAIHNLGCGHYNGEYGLPQDYEKALDLWHQAGELGYTDAYHNIAPATYYNGNGVERDMKKAKHYWELAAMGGHVNSMFNLGMLEKNEGNMNRALKHYMIAVGCGHDLSIEKVREFYMNGRATKDVMQRLCGHIKSILMESRVLRGMKLLHSTVMSIVIIKAVCLP